MFARVRTTSPVLAYPKAYWYLLVGMLLNGTATFVLPFEAIYLVAVRHFSVAQAAAVVAVYGGGSCVSALLGGVLADRLGRRPTIIVGLLCLAATTFGLAFATPVWLIALLTFLMGFWISWYRPASTAVIVDLVPLAEQVRANGLLYWMYNIGMAISPLLASLIVQNTSYPLLFCVDGVGTILFALLMIVGLPETRPTKATLVQQRVTPHTSTPRRQRVLRDLPFLCFLGLSLVLTSIYFQNAATLPADMQQHGFSAAQYGVAISVNGIVVVLLGLPLTHLLTRCTPFRAVALAALFLGLGFGLTFLADTQASLPFYIGSIAIWTIGEILYVPASATVVALFSPDQQRGLYQGLARTSWGLSACLGPLFGGIIFQQWGSAALWVGCAGLGTLVAGGFLMLEQCRTSQANSDNDELLDSPVAVVAQQAEPSQGVETGQLPPFSTKLAAGLPSAKEAPASSLMSVRPTILSPESEVYLARCDASLTHSKAQQGAEAR